MEENTKDYSKVYQEEVLPVPNVRRSTMKSLDGAHLPRRHRETGSMGIDPDVLTKALYNLSAEQQNAYAINTLQQHYSAVSKKKTRPCYKVYLNYFEDGRKKDTYLVRVEFNTLAQIKQKLPIKGNFRFFIHNGSIIEEFEDDYALLPLVERDGARIIYCQLFPC